MKKLLANGAGLVMGASLLLGQVGCVETATPEWEPLIVGSVEQSQLIVESDCFALTCPAVLDFEVDANGEAIEPGQNLRQVYAEYGVHIYAWADANMTTPRRPIAFDSSQPTGGDTDLGTPNAQYGGPGVGVAGENNHTALGNLLIGAEDVVDLNLDGLVDDPDDHAAGTTFEVVFDYPACVYSMHLIDIEDTEQEVQFVFRDVTGATVADAYVAGDGDNSVVNLQTDVCGVSSMLVSLSGSGAIDRLEVCPDPDLAPAGTVCGDEPEPTPIDDGVCVPTTEICDGIDNDCDGETDEIEDTCGIGAICVEVVPGTEYECRAH